MPSPSSGAVRPHPDCGWETNQEPAHDGAVDSAPVGLQRLTPQEKRENLTSPRFAGEPRLERAFDNAPVLGSGESGDPVVRVQEALVAGGASMPVSTTPTGAMDGVFGKETARAVRDFQTGQGLSPDARLGRKTLGALDKQGGPAPAPDVEPPDPSLEEIDVDQDDTSCPAPDQIETAVAAQPAQAQALVAASVPADPAPAAGLTNQVRTDPLAAAVTRFKGGANVAGGAASENIAQVGQFFWGRRVRLATMDKIELLTATDARTLPFILEARAVAELIRARAKTADARLNALANMVRTLPVNPAARKVMLEVVAPPNRDPAQLEKFLWSGLNASVGNTVPPFASQDLSLRVARMLSLFDKQACGFHAHKIAERLANRGVTPKKNVVAFSTDLVTSAPFADQDRVVRSGQLRGEVVRQTNVGSAVPKMQAALDAGQVLHARVLSGIGYGHEVTAPPGMVVRGGRVLSPEPPEEHSLVVIGHNGSGTLVFNDPDAQVSHSPEDGFGLMFFDAGRGSLTMAGGASDVAVDTNGAHVRGDKRYQVLTISTF